MILAAGTASACLIGPQAADAASPGKTALRIESYVRAGVRREALQAALKAYESRKNQIKQPRFLTLIDYAVHSSKPRMFVIDMVTGKMKKLLVAHGKGSDPDHDGYATSFSNKPGSLASSIGAFITANTYHGKHGLSLRLVGLDPTNNAALARAIVMHGADYVRPGRGIGRSWGCPSIERRHAKTLIPQLAGGSFLYITH